jgi:hypothetical protein
MRKQDRIRQQENQNQSQQETEPRAQPTKEQKEQMKGSAGTDQPAKPPRESGKLPLPE